jgi:FAD/FMN-containing dehydrogenase
MITRRELLQVASGFAAATAAAATADRSRSQDLLKGKIFYKGDNNYEAYRLASVWNARKPNRYPAAICLPESDAEVIAAVKLASARGWEVGTRSGGHSWVAPHIRDNALLINLSRMRDISVDPRTRIAAVRPSVQGQVLNKLLREHQLMFPSAHGYGVGLGGFILCGGHGWNSRLWGLGCDNLQALDVVTADGDLIHADETQNSDYLWAARGAGPGFFGVATRYYLNLHQLPNVMTMSTYIYPTEVADELLTWFGDTQNSFPKTLEVLVSTADLNGKPALRLLGSTLAYSESEAASGIEVLESCPVAHRAVMKTLNLPVVLPADAESGSDLEPTPTGARYVVDGSWTNAPAHELVPLARPAFLNPRPTQKSFFFWIAWGRDVPKHKDMAYSLSADAYLSSSAVSYDPAQDKDCEEWVDSNVARLQPVSIGGQMSDENMVYNKNPYLSPEAESRLKKLCSKYDPEHRFVSYLKN